MKFLKGRLVFNEKEIKSIVSKLNFQKGNGLISVITQDFKTNQVLMMAFANKEAVEQTLSSGYVHYWSRSRNELWKKGSTSGHLQLVKEIYIDCDADALLIKIDQIGAACHENYRTCFFRKIEEDNFNSKFKKIK
ncbi:MAG: phosphoribosyl-AMP cyclohydrolase [Candidatus Helarchaeota archaeon]